MPWQEKGNFAKDKNCQSIFFLLRILYIHMTKTFGLLLCKYNAVRNLFFITIGQDFYGMILFSLLCHCHHGSVENIVGLAIHVIEGLATALVAEKNESHLIICRWKWALQLHIHWAAFLRVLYTISQRWIQRWLGSILKLPFSQARYL